MLLFFKMSLRTQLVTEITNANLICYCLFFKSLRTEPVIEITDANLTWYRPFYSCQLGDLAFEWQRGWS